MWSTSFGVYGSGSHARESNVSAERDIHARKMILEEFYRTRKTQRERHMGIKLCQHAFIATLDKGDLQTTQGKLTERMSVADPKDMDRLTSAGSSTKSSYRHFSLHSSMCRQGIPSP
jgi:hypothetical protein